ncbi:hypothetical protein QE109_02105 [Fusibacter bizertensis]|uniref:Uncharacterized protein n=1 Tax=Fusibacter bizertensis TaxID=1488331 RepID=A0ABT6N925_9FIRM|nr:hypothetical protein [Fusibacter bizertensis]MDH8676919.1 hypothetical protein [Fusibacter bizertensis]
MTNLIVISGIILVTLIVFSFFRNRYINFVLGISLITLWMPLAISLPFFLIYAFKIEGLYLLAIMLMIYTIYFVRSNFFLATEVSDHIEMMNLSKSVRLYIKSLYMTTINTIFVIILIMIALGAVSLYPLLVLCSSVWFIPVAILGALAGVVIFGVVMMGLIPTVAINIIFTLNGVTRLTSALNYNRNEKLKRILYSLIPFWGIYDGIKLLKEANYKLKSKDQIYDE